MTREEAKQLLPIILAYAEGKTIQLRERSNCPNCYVDLDNNVHFDTYPAEYYRVKPEPKYRPFKDAEEYWQEMKNHQPFGYVIDKTTKLFSNIGMLDNRGILTLCTQYSCSLKESFNRYTFADGTPFGIKEGADD